jgi:hypothetical protein
MVPSRQPNDHTPRWVKIQGVLVALLMLAVIAMSTGLLARHGRGDGGSMYHAPSSHNQHMDRHQ